MRRIDQREMGERLGEVAQQTMLLRMIFFREQSDIVAQLKQALEETLGVGLPSHQGIIIRQPETAGDKNALAR